jgi:copper(I)-binding protein
MAVAIGLTAAASLVAQNNAVKASNAWVRVPAEGQTNTIAVAAVENPGMYAIYILTATSDAAGKVEFRDASKNDAVVEEVPIENHDTTYMDPKGLHMLLSDLKRPLKEGDTVNITLKTDQGDAIAVSAVVKKD